jgi:hypothetical protein
LQGLVTFLAFLAFWSLRSCFIPEVLTGFPSQSLSPGLKACSPLGLQLLSCGSSFECISGCYAAYRETKTHASEFYSLNPGRIQPGWFRSRPNTFALSGFSPLRSYYRTMESASQFLLFHGWKYKWPKSIIFRPSWSFTRFGC